MYVIVTVMCAYACLDTRARDTEFVKIKPDCYLLIYNTCYFTIL